MSVQMTFYSNFSKRVNSTKQPTDGTTYDVVFKGDFSILGSTVNLQVGFDIAKNFTMAKYGNTYFNITNVVSISNSLVEISLEIDVLATYKSEIASYESVIERSPNSSFSVDIDDNTISPTGRYTYSEHTFSMGISNVCYQIKTKNSEGAFAYFLSPDALDDLFKKFEINILRNEYKYIESIKLVPINLAKIKGVEASSVYIGDQKYDIGSGSCIKIISAQTSVIMDESKLTSSIATMYSDARRYNNNYVDISLLLDGRIFNIDPNYLRASAFVVDAYLDCISLDVLFQFSASYGGDGNFLIASSNTNIGVGLQFSDTPNMLEAVVSAISNNPLSASANTLNSAARSSESAWFNSRLRSGEKARTGKFTAIMSPDGGIGLVKKGLLSNLGSGISGVSAYAATVLPIAFPLAVSAYKNTMTTTTVSTQPGTSLIAYTFNNIKICVKEFESVDQNMIEFGYPYMRYENINKIGSTGYYKFVAPNIELDSVQSIKGSINEYLLNGFFYE